MKARTMVVTLALCFVGVAVCLAEDANMGTWKLNEAKSKIAPGAPKNSTVVYEAAGDNVKVTIDGTDGEGERSEEHTSELQSRRDLVCRLLLEKKKKKQITKCDAVRTGLRLVI